MLYSQGHDNLRSFFLFYRFYFIDKKTNNLTVTHMIKKNKSFWLIIFNLFIFGKFDSENIRILPFDNFAFYLLFKH